MTTTHALKVWPEYFAAIVDGTKTFEVRRNDRKFALWDVLILAEWNPATEEFTGRRVCAWASYILPGGDFGIAKDFCVMGLSIIPGGLINAFDLFAFQKDAPA